jgi:uncharacterized repeat protein (TIGR03803 family)
MNSTNCSLFFRAALNVAAITFSLAVCAQAQTFTTLAAFNGGNGEYPSSGSLIQATNGNYYGTAEGGGKYGWGVVFEVTPAGKLSDLYSFCSQTNCADGMSPLALVLGSDGNFYGATSLAGNNSYSGTIFKMTMGGKLTTLYSFCPAGGSCSDGQYPVGLVQASNGNIYGTTVNGGAVSYAGTIFEISSAGKFKLLYSFCSKSNCTDGYKPLSAPTQASNGSLWGTTNGGGVHGGGSVYEITPSGLFKTLYSFCAQAKCADGQYPIGGLIQGSNGSMYGTTESGGAYGYGAVFEITSTNQFIVLHSFDNTDGANPGSALLQASDGNLYGTAIYGGGINNAGTIYEITSGGVFRSLYSFCLPSSCNGYYPEYALAQATDGTFIGATIYTQGVAEGYGTVFSFSTGLGPLVETVPVAAKVGKRVIILGNGLTGSTSVTFDGTAAAFTVVSDTYITATVPIGATSGKVAVTTPAGTLYSNPAFQVTK